MCILPCHQAKSMSPLGTGLRKTTRKETIRKGNPMFIAEKPVLSLKSIFYTHVYPLSCEPDTVLLVYLT